MSLDSKFTEITSQTGKKPKLLSSDFDGPDVWSVMSEVISKLHEVPTTQYFEDTSFKLNQLFEKQNNNDKIYSDKLNTLFNSYQSLTDKMQNLNKNSNSTGIFKHIHTNMT